MIELLVVVALIGVLAIMAMPIYFKYIDLAKGNRAEADIRTIEKAVQAYYIDRNTYPPDLQTIGMNILDPWNRPYEYRCPPVLMGPDLITPWNGDFDIYSKGPDGIAVPDDDAPSSDDDIIRAGDGWYVGLRHSITQSVTP